MAPYFFFLYMYIINLISETKIILKISERNDTKMYSADALKEATKYLSRYNGLKKIINTLDDDRYMPIIIMNVFRVRKLENYGVSLEDLFMETYISIKELTHSGNNPSNPTRVIQRGIMKSICDDFIVSMTWVEMLNDIIVDNLSMRKDVVAYDIHRYRDDESTQFVDEIMDKLFVGELLRYSSLTDLGRLYIKEYFNNNKSSNIIAKEHGRSTCTIDQHIHKALHILRNRCRSWDLERR